MSFSIPKKTMRHVIGIFSAVFITGFMTFGFLQSYQQSKQRQVQKVDLVEVAIFADKLVASIILYEAVPYAMIPSAECIKQRSDSTSMTSSFAASSAAISSVAIGVKASTASVKKSPVRREPSLIAAHTPKCIAPSIAPSGYIKLGSDGFVGLALNLDKTGRVERGEIEKSSGFADLDAAALTQVTETWQFEPCKKQNKVVACKQHIRFRWEVK